MCSGSGTVDMGDGPNAPNYEKCDGCSGSGEMSVGAPPSLKPLIVWLVMGDRSYNADWSPHSVWSTAAGANRECDRLRAQDRHPRCQWKVVPAALDQISEDWICPNAS